jgi:solute carrier family 25 folate transporter 32
MSWGLYFYWYNTIKMAIQQSLGEKEHEMSAAHHLTAAALAGTVTLVFTNPIWVVKTRMCLQYTHPYSTDNYLGMGDALLKIYRSEGVAGFYKGFLPGLLGVSHGALQFMAYEQLKQYYAQSIGLPQLGQLGSLEYILLAALSKVFASVTTYPFQVLRSRLQDKQTTYVGMLDVLVRTYRNEGLLGFYKGLVPNVIRLAAIVPYCAWVLEVILFGSPLSCYSLLACTQY